MNLKNRIKQYIEESLIDHDIVGKYTQVASILFRGSQKLDYQDDYCDWDIELLLPNNEFKKFAEEYGPRYVLVDKNHRPEIFIRVRSYRWLREKFLREPIVCAWIYQESLIIQDPNGSCGQIINLGVKRFKKQCRQWTREKYIEFRAHRHDLRSSLARNLEITERFVRSAMTKSFLEFVLLLHGKPYPYKKWLASIVEQEIDNGKVLTKLCQDLLTTHDRTKLLKLDANLLEFAITLGKKHGLEEKYLNEWWFHLD